MYGGKLPVSLRFNVRRLSHFHCILKNRWNWYIYTSILIWLFESHFKSDQTYSLVALFFQVISLLEDIFSHHRGVSCSHCRKLLFIRPHKPGNSFRLNSNVLCCCFFLLFVFVSTTRIRSTSPVKVKTNLFKNSNRKMWHVSQHTNINTSRKHFCSKSTQSLHLEYSKTAETWVRYW